MKTTTVKLKHILRPALVFLLLISSREIPAGSSSSNFIHFTNTLKDGLLHFHLDIILLTGIV